VETALEKSSDRTGPTPRQADPAATTATRRRILIIDDDRDVAEGTAEFLHDGGYSIAIAHTAQGAIKAARNFDAQVALVDMKLGRDDNGLDLIGTLLQLRPRLVPVVVSAYRTEQAIAAALQSGAREFLKKPFHPQDLFDLLDRCFARPDPQENPEPTPQATRAA
jgi:DNA-binding NtrC family response regulator